MVDRQTHRVEMCGFRYVHIYIHTQDFDTHIDYVGREMADGILQHIIIIPVSFGPLKSGREGFSS